MAITVTAGDIEYDTGGVVREGNRNVVHGQLGADTTLRTFAITGTSSRLVSAQLTVADNTGDAPTTVMGIINENADSTATNGTIAVDAGAATDVRFRIEYV